MEVEACSAAPRITLDIEHAIPDQTVPTTLPYRLQIKISLQPDDINKPCIIKWDPFNDGLKQRHFTLLEETEHGLERVDVGQPGPSNSNREPVQINNNTRSALNLHELQPSESIIIRATLPEYYQRPLKPGHRYRLQWNGTEVGYWTWGSFTDKKGSKMQYRGGLVVPKTEGIAFTATEEAIPWPGRAREEALGGFNTANILERQWRLRLEARHRADAEANASSSERQKLVQDDAIKLNVTLEAPTTISLGNKFIVAAKITLRDQSPDAKPITFHTHRIDRGFRLARQRKLQPGDAASRQTWENCPRDDTTGFIIVEAPDGRVNVSTHKDFTSLGTGQVWTCEYNPAEADLPQAIAPGDRFRVWYRGIELDWWDYGDAERHARTEVMLPCFIAGDVVDPKNNDGRPAAWVGSSNDVEFTVQE